jgi:methylmalonyl-CoA epimerase
MMDKIDHIGIAVQSVEEARRFYEDILGLSVLEVLEMPDRGVKAGMIDVGGVTLELLEPLGEGSLVAKHIEKRGEGIHHIAYRVADIDAAMETLKRQGVEFITPEPKIGAHGRRIAFLSPKSCHGVLIELCENI